MVGLKTIKEKQEILSKVRPFIFDFLEEGAFNADDYEWYEEELYERGICSGTGFTDVCTGATKLVIVSDSDYVVKIPFNRGEDGEFYCVDRDECSEWDYCEAESYLYMVAKEEHVEKIFAETICIGYIEGYPIYIQDKVDKASCYYNSRYSNKLKRWVSSKMSDKEYLKYTHISDNLSCYLNKDFMKIINDCYGVRFLISVLVFIKNNDINDLHCSNIGTMADGRPVIFDYSGFGE